MNPLEYFPKNLTFEQTTKEFDALASGAVARAHYVRKLQPNPEQFRIVIRKTSSEIVKGVTYSNSICGFAEDANSTDSNLFIPTPYFEGENSITPDRDGFILCKCSGRIRKSDLLEFDESRPGSIDKAIQLFRDPEAAQLQKELNDSIWFAEERRVRKLLTSGAHANCPSIISDKWESTLVRAFWASSQNSNHPKHLNVLKMLIDAGADVNEQGPDGWTPLMALCWGIDFYEKGSVAPLEMLIAAGADLRASNVNGNTILMYAAQSGTANRVGCLIGAGANLFAKNIDGLMAFDIAIKHGNHDCATLLRSSMDTHAMNQTIESAVKAPELPMDPVVPRRRANIF